MQHSPDDQLEHSTTERVQSSTNSPDRAVWSPRLAVQQPEKVLHCPKRCPFPWVPRISQSLHAQTAPESPASDSMDVEHVFIPCSVPGCGVEASLWSTCACSHSQPVRLSRHADPLAHIPMSCSRGPRSRALVEKRAFCIACWPLQPFHQDLGVVVDAAVMSLALPARRPAKSPWLNAFVRVECGYPPSPVKSGGSGTQSM